MKELMNLLNQEIPETRAVVTNRITERARKRLIETWGTNSSEIPRVLFVCPFTATKITTYNPPEDMICNYHYSTGEKPKKIDCYLCRKE